MSAPVEKDCNTALPTAAPASAMADAAARMAAAVAQMAAAAAAMAIATPVGSFNQSATTDVQSLGHPTSDVDHSVATASLTPYEIYEKSCRSASEVFGTPELLENILLYEDDHLRLFVLTTVNKLFKRTISASAIFQERMFLAKPRIAPGTDIKEYAMMNPLLSDPTLTPDPLRIFEFSNLRVGNNMCVIQCGSASYDYSWDWKSIQSFIDRAGLEVDGGIASLEPKKVSSWEAMWVLNFSLPARIIVGLHWHPSDRCPNQEAFFLPPNSTMGELNASIIKLAGGYTMKGTNDDLILASASMARHAQALAAIAAEQARWTADVAEEVVRQAAGDSMSEQTQKAATVDRHLATSTTITSLENTSTASQRIFAITKLTEAILADEAISICQLFVLQRTNRRFKNTITGSIALRKKLWPSPATDPDFTDGTLLPFLNPLLGDKEQCFTCFETACLDDKSFYFGEEGPTASIQMMVGYDDTAENRISQRARLMEFAAGDAVEPGSWQNMLIYENAAKLNMSVDHSLLEERGLYRASGVTLGELVRSLAVVSTRELERFFVQASSLFKDGMSKDPARLVSYI
ncbi:hypothetical protein B0A48_01258 [Cryoendolithus antarcticus]|uniref:Uncharacterized protein n=1 Tax=Cryoendolithus antarcticus TaxID=1507870 RepID=A0A1V8TT87_9PEZI|nr:hypothetical protein B0A48_01258 [Cryoendolithus antarcticus]